MIGFVQWLIASKKCVIFIVTFVGNTVDFEKQNKGWQMTQSYKSSVHATDGASRGWKSRY